MSLLDQPTIKENVPWLDAAIGPDKRDYSRPREPFQMSTTPLDLPEDQNEGWLGDAWTAVKKFVGLDDSVSEEEKKEVEKKIDEDLEALKKEKEEKKKEPPKVMTQDMLILAFQSFFSKSHPVIGQLYSGPKDGKMNPQLQTAAHAAESKISSAIGKSTAGMILSGDKFTTSPGDVRGAISLIAKSKRASELSRKERMNVFSSLLSK